MTLVVVGMPAPWARGAAGQTRSGPAAGVPRLGSLRRAIWIRLAQVSSNVAVVTGPIWADSWVNPTELLQPGDPGGEIVHGGGRVGDAVADQRLLEGLGGGMPVGFEQQFGAVRIVGRGHGQPPVLAERYVGLLREAEQVGVEPQCFVLVVDVDAGQVDRPEPGWRGPPRADRARAARPTRRR